MRVLSFVSLPTMAVLTKAQIKHIQSFANKKSRELLLSYLVEGVKSVQDCLQHGAVLQQIYVTQLYGFANEILIPDYEMEKISLLSNPSTVVALFEKPPILQVPTANTCLIIDGIQDPGNLGTILRTAHWFGIHQIVCSLDTVDFFNPKTIQASMGSIAALQLFKTDILLFLQKNNKRPSYATSLAGKPLQEVTIEKNALIIIGQEGKGIRQEVLDLCTHQIKIPGAPGAESLNAAVAAGIVCHHFFLQEAV
jgi:RNA methyltransferase, TrmH family